jgi:hypothetical protein
VLPTDPIDPRQEVIAMNADLALACGRILGGLTGGGARRVLPVWLVFSSVVLSASGHGGEGADGSAQLSSRLRAATAEEARALLIKVGEGARDPTDALLAREVIGCRARFGDRINRELRMSLLAIAEGVERELPEFLTAGGRALREAALWSIEYLCPRQGRVEDSLLVLLEDPDASVRFLAARALPWVRWSPGGRASAALARHVKDGGSVGSAALAAVVRGEEGEGVALDALREALNSRDPSVFSTGVVATRMVALKTDVLRETLIRIAADRSAAGIVRLSALESLRVQGVRTRDAIGMCKRLLTERDLSSLRAEAIMLAGEQSVGALAGDARLCLEMALDDDDSDVRRAAARAAQRMGAGTVEPLLALVASGPERKRQAGLLALANLGRLAVSGREAVSRVMRESSVGYTRFLAIQSLAAMGVAGSELLPSIQDLLSKDDLPSRFALVQWLKTRGGELQALTGALLRIVADEEDPLFIEAIPALVAIGRGQPEIQTALRTLMRASDERARCLAATELATSGSRAPEDAVAILRAGLDRDSVGFLAIDGVKRLGAAGRWAAPKLRDLLLRSNDAGVRLGCAEALAAQGDWDACIEETLIALAMDPGSAERRIPAIQVLGCAPRISTHSRLRLYWCSIGEPDVVLRDAARAACRVR